MVEDKVMMPMPIHMDVIVQQLIQFHSAYPWVGILFLLMAIDICAGFFAACVTKTLSSTTSQAGMSKKALMILMVGTGAIMQPYAQGLALSQMIATVYIITELISITENVARSGVPMPEIVMNLLQKLRGEKASVNDSQQSNATTSITVGRASSIDIHTDGAESTKQASDGSVIIKTSQKTES